MTLVLLHGPRVKQYYTMLILFSNTLMAVTASFTHTHIRTCMHTYTHTQEEYEDTLGNVVNKKTYEDLRRQGLL